MRIVFCFLISFYLMPIHALANAAISADIQKAKRCEGSMTKFKQLCNRNNRSTPQVGGSGTGIKSGARDGVDAAAINNAAAQEHLDKCAEEYKQTCENSCSDKKRPQASQDAIRLFDDSKRKCSRHKAEQDAKSKEALRRGGKTKDGGEKTGSDADKGKDAGKSEQGGGQQQQQPQQGGGGPQQQGGGPQQQTPQEEPEEEDDEEKEEEPESENCTTDDGQPGKRTQGANGEFGECTPIEEPPPINSFQPCLDPNTREPIPNSNCTPENRANDAATLSTSGSTTQDQEDPSKLAKSLMDTATYDGKYNEAILEGLKENLEKLIASDERADHCAAASIIRSLKQKDIHSQEIANTYAGHLAAKMGLAAGYNDFEIDMLCGQ